MEFEGHSSQEDTQRRISDCKQCGEQTKKSSTRDLLHFDQINNCMEGNGSQVPALRWENMKTEKPI